MAHILIIDDDVSVRTMLRKMLEREGYEVVKARDGREGLHQYQAAPTDVIILDLLMPEQQGVYHSPLLFRASPSSFANHSLIIVSRVRRSCYDCCDVASETDEK